MYLKSLTMKGFKSFADPTTLDLEPGVTVVVGPNGSGKSNVVDAVAWVLGAQGPRVVRSAKMDDVIFAGTAKRSALGRAEVSLVIDNSSRRLPIDFAEVTITRTLFRSGDSEYAINGVSCRLLDVQELLSDSGVGRQQHVIVGQGQLDAILTARPEDRRMVIEEAAGVLKYRRRRERAVRRLESSGSALLRLQDLLREVRRQIRPLERQAASALRHESIVSELRALRLFIAGQELNAFEAQVATATRRIEELDGEIGRFEQRKEELDGALGVAEQGLATERAEDLTPTVSQMAQLGERTRGMLAVLAERRRAGAELSAALDDVAGVANLETALARVREDLSQCEAAAAAVGPEWDLLSSEEESLSEAEAEHRETYREMPSDEKLNEASKARNEVTSALAELGAARERRARLGERRDALSRRQSELEIALAGAVATLHQVRTDLARVRAEHVVAVEASKDAEVGLGAADRATDAATHEHHSLAGRVDALALALDEARARAGVERLADLDGVLGTLADLVVVDERYLRAFEMALEGVLDSAVVAGHAQARTALERLRELSVAGSILVAPSMDQRQGVTALGAPPPAGTRWLREVVAASDPGVVVLLDRLLEGVLVCDAEFGAAVDLALHLPQMTVVTLEGHRFTPLGWRIGAAGNGATRDALESARERLAEALAKANAVTARRDGARADLERARAALAELSRRLDFAVSEERRLEASRAESELQLFETGNQLTAAIAEMDEIDRDAATADARVSSVQLRLEIFETEESEARTMAAAALSARQELDARRRAVGALRRDLEVRAAGLEERRRLLASRKEELLRDIESRHASRLAAEERRTSHGIELVACEALGRELDAIAAQLSTAHATMATERDRRAAIGRERLQQLGDLRRRREDVGRSIGVAREHRQTSELELTEARIRLEAAIESLSHELDAVPDEARSVARPDLPPGVEPAARRRSLERDLGEIGPVNPLAREELTVLEDRSVFLETQLEDVRSARRELNQVIHAIDAEIVEVFTKAYTDVAFHFGELITTLFPGGSGQLSLTAPDDLLASGVEIEARPAGRNVRRLSLLSGGEKSLVAMAFLFAVFRSRPSPFYLMDEVEAALDEVNLRRFLDLVNEFRDEAQLIIVSHQKKTMEVADALYGITMQPGGGSKVVSERLSHASGGGGAMAGLSVSVESPVTTGARENQPMDRFIT